MVLVRSVRTVSAPVEEIGLKRWRHSGVIRGDRAFARPACESKLARDALRGIAPVAALDIDSRMQ
jgi:hypothetical protein